MSEKKKEPSILEDDQINNSEFDEMMMEEHLKTMKESNPDLHAIMMKYKNHHADEKTTKED